MAHHDNTTGVDGTHKPTMGEKLGGKMESMVGKMTGNHAKVVEGEAKATGNLPATGAHGTDAHGAHGNTLGHDNRTTGTGLTGDNHGTHGTHGTGLTGDNHGTHGTGLTGNNTHGSTGTYPATGAIPPHQGSGLTGNNHGTGLTGNNHGTGLTGNNHGTGLTGNRDTYGNDNYGSTPVVVGGATHGSGLTGNNHGTGIAGNRDTYGNDHHGHQGEKKESLLDKITPGHNAHGFEGNQESRVGHDNYGTTGVAGTHGTGLAGNNHGTGVTGHREPYTVPGNTHGTTHGAGLNAGGPYRDDDLKTRGTEKKSLLDKITPGHNAHGFSGNQTGSATDGLGARDQGLAGRYQDAGIITPGHNNRGVNDNYGQTAHPTGFTGGNTIGNQHVNTTHYDGNTSHGNPLGHNTATTGSTVGHHGTTGYADNNTAYGDDRNRADHKSGGLMDKISDKLSGNKDDRLEQDRVGHGAHGTQGAQGVPPAYGGQYAGDANRNTAL